nr:MAG TPA: hypothetical protein [Caudoviricetes sp.]
MSFPCPGSLIKTFTCFYNCSRCIIRSSYIVGVKILRKIKAHNILLCNSSEWRPVTSNYVLLAFTGASIARFFLNRWTKYEQDRTNQRYNFILLVIESL